MKPKVARRIAKTVYLGCLRAQEPYALPLAAAMCKAHRGIGGRVLLRAVGARAVDRVVVQRNRDNPGAGKLTGHAYELDDRLYLHTDHDDRVVEITEAARTSGWTPGALRVGVDPEAVREARAATAAQVREHMGEHGESADPDAVAHEGSPL